MIVLTATNYLANYLQNNSQQVEKITSRLLGCPNDNDHKVTLRKPYANCQIVSLHHWLLQCGKKITSPTAKQLLTKTQTRFLWQRLVSEDTHQHNATSASLAEKAAYLCQQWATYPSTWDGPLTPASEAFKHWFERFDAYCKDHNYCDAASLPRYLMPHFVENTFSLREPILFVGFNDHPPYLKELINALKRHCPVFVGTPAYSPNASLSTHTAVSLACPTPQTEYQLAAQWALKQHTLHPEQSIGCVVLDLPRWREQVETTFKAVFNPGYRWPGNYTEHYPFNIAGGKPLATYPLIHHTLSALKLLTTTEISLQDSGLILQSPFFNTSKASIENAKIDVQFREQGYSTLTLDNPLLPAWFSPLKQARADIDSQQKRPARDWTEQIKQWLTHLGWPGDRPCNSEEYQLTQRWEALLEELAHLSDWLGPCSYATVLTYLTDLTHYTLFQAKHQTTTNPLPVQIMGPTEAASLYFDQLWVTGMHQANWPIPAEPHPFLPLAIQRKLAMPQASPTHTLAFCTSLTAQLKASSPTVICSYPQQVDNQPTEKSTLMASLPTVHEAELGLTRQASLIKQPFVQKTVQPSRLLFNERAPCLAPDEKITGDAMLLKEQADCPFKAFASRRLNAKPLDDANDSFNALDQGILVHAALDKIWKQLKDHSTLCRYNEIDRSLLINHSIEAAITQLKKKRATILSDTLVSLEKKRLASLLDDWLHYESQRPPFKVIASEKAYHAQLGKLSFALRFDRIDQLINGDYIIIDYKTNNTSDLHLLGERPEAPQLPLYCILFKEHPINGVVFAEIHAKKMLFKGIVAASDQFPSSVKTIDSINSKHTASTSVLPTDWPSLKGYWHDKLKKLSDDFAQGMADVDPKNPPVTCQRCNLQTLCRLYTQPAKENERIN